MEHVIWSLYLPVSNIDKEEKTSRQGCVAAVELLIVGLTTWYQNRNAKFLHKQPSAVRIWKIKMKSINDKRAIHCWVCHWGLCTTGNLATEYLYLYKATSPMGSSETMYFQYLNTTARHRNQREKTWACLWWTLHTGEQQKVGFINAILNTLEYVAILTLDQLKKDVLSSLPQLCKLSCTMEEEIRQLESLSLSLARSLLDLPTLAGLTWTHMHYSYKIHVYSLCNTYFDIFVYTHASNFMHCFTVK